MGKGKKEDVTGEMKEEEGKEERERKKRGKGYHWMRGKIEDNKRTVEELKGSKRKDETWEWKKEIGGEKG